MARHMEVATAVGPLCASPDLRFPGTLAWVVRLALFFFALGGGAGPPTAGASVFLVMPACLTSP